MSGQRDHPHVPGGNFTPHRPTPTLPANTDRFLDAILASPPHHMDLDGASSAATMPTLEEQLQQLRELAGAQQQQIQQQQQQMDEAKAHADVQTQQLLESKRQLEASQASVAELTSAFRDLTSTSRPLTVSTVPKKKPELPPFDSRNILIWIRRVEAAYNRAGVIEPKDKFSWMESIFQVKLDPQIDAYLYGTNTAQEWDDFIAYLKFQYGPTLRQKTQKLLGDNPRHDLRPSQYLVQLEEETKDVTVDMIRREHLLKTIPPRIREIMGKEVETMTAKEVATAADTFFDRQGKPLEKATAPISHVTAAPTPSSTPPTTATTPSSPFTPLFNDDDNTDVNQVRRGNFRGNGGRGRSQSRGQRSQSRPSGNRIPNASSTGGNNGDGKANSQPGLCRWHRLFGDKSRKCVTDCPRFKSHLASQQAGNGQGGRRQ